MAAVISLSLHALLGIGWAAWAARRRRELALADLLALGALMSIISIASLGLLSGHATMAMALDRMALVMVLKNLVCLPLFGALLLRERSRQRTEAALRESELRLRLALEAAQMGTFEADIAGETAMIDAQEARLLGLPEDTRVVSVDELRARIPLADLQASDAKKRTMERRAKATPLGRCVTADDVAEVMLSLIQGNRFVTGEIVVIDGGFSSTT